MNNNPDEAYNALFRSYEAANREVAKLKKRVIELEAQLALEHERATNALGEMKRLRSNHLRDMSVQAKKREELEAQLALERESNLNNVANADLQFAEMQAEITRLCEQFRREGGCAREQGNSQWCAEAQRLAKDAAILDWIADSGFIETVMGGVLNVHEQAIEIANERDVDAEPTVEDYRLALRQIVLAAMAEEAAQAGDGVRAGMRVACPSSCNEHEWHVAEKEQ